MQYKVLALDLDGTLTNSEKIITPRTKAALQEAARRQGMVTGFYQSPTVPESTGAEPASEVEAMEEAPADSSIVPSTI